MLGPVFNFANVERKPVAGPSIDRLTVEIASVDETNDVHSFISGTVCHVPVDTDEKLKNIVRRDVAIHTFLPAQKIADMNEIMLERVAFEDFEGKPATGHLECLTLKRMTYLVSAIKHTAGLTELSGTIHYLDPRYNSKVGLMLEGTYLKLQTHIPSQAVSVNQPLFLEKVEMVMTNTSPVLLGLDPRPPAVIPEHPDFRKTCHEAIYRTALTNLSR